MTLYEYTIEVFEDNDTPLSIDLFVEGTDDPYVLDSVDSMEFVVKATRGESAGEVISTYTTSSGITIVDPPEGKVLVVTDGIAAGSYRYKLDAITSGDRVTVMAGPYVVRQT